MFITQTYSTTIAFSAYELTKNFTSVFVLVNFIVFSVVNPRFCRLKKALHIEMIIGRNYDL
jgi:hypothetical protein